MKREKQKPLMKREEQDEQAERLKAHQAQFEARRRRAAFGRWKASMHLTPQEKRAIADRPLPPLASLPKRS